MIRFFRYLLLVLAGLFSFAGHLSATTVYPLQLNAQIIPPYSNCLGDMVAGNVTSIRVTGLLRDLKTQSYNVGIGMQVYQGSQLKFATKTNHTEVVTNNTIHNFNLKDLFSPNNITGRYDGDGYCLKEGGYEFVFQAFDGGNARLPLSEPVRIHVYLSQAEPPRIIAPANGECVNYNAPVNFVWMEGAVTSYNPNRSYRLEIVELPEQTENFDAKSYINNNSTKITVEGIPGNLNFYTFQNTAGKLVKGRSYLWRVQLYDKTQMVSDARTVYSTSSAVANGGYSEVYTFKYTNCDPFGQRVEDQIDESKKPEIVRVDSSEAFSTVVWKNDPENFPCGYIVCFNRADDTLSNWARVEVGPTDSTYTFKNVENGVQYLTHIIGIVDCQDDGTKMLSANSDNGSFTLPVPAEQECSTTIDGLTSQYSVENLSPNDYFTANDRNIKINKIDRFIEGSDTTFSGEGQVLCPWFPSISLTTKFEKVKINRNHELVKGVVYVPTDSSNSGFFDLDEMMNDNYTGDGPAEQMTGKFKEYSKTDDIPEGSLGVVNGELYAMVNGEPVDLGKVVEASDYEGKIQKENIDAKSGIVDFEAISYWNPPIDNDREKYTGDIDRYYTNYSTSSGNYTVPWFAMPDGSTAEIKAKLQVNDNFPLDKLKFVCLTGSQAVELNAQKTQESGDFVYYKLPIFGGEGETSLNLYAVATDKNGNNITLGRAQILSMPKFEQEVVLIPVQREASSIDQAAIEKKLNEIYKPLGIAYKVKVADKFDSEELEFMKDGLEVSGSGFLSTETDAMKQLKKLYAQNHTIEKDVAYIFVCPKAKYDGAEVKGDMPRSGQTGYVFSTAETYNDGWTIAHELGHGLYSFEHTFPHDKQGTTDNLMDYANGTNLKVWQWNLLYSHKDFTIPFLESDEDGMEKIVPIYLRFNNEDSKNAFMKYIESVVLQKSNERNNFEASINVNSIDDLPNELKEYYNYFNKISNIDGSKNAANFENFKSIIKNIYNIDKNRAYYLNLIGSTLISASKKYTFVKSASFDTYYESKEIYFQEYNSDVKMYLIDRSFLDDKVKPAMQGTFSDLCEGSEATMKATISTLLHECVHAILPLNGNSQSLQGKNDKIVNCWSGGQVFWNQPFIDMISQPICDNKKSWYGQFFDIINTLNSYDDKVKKYLDEFKDYKQKLAEWKKNSPNDDINKPKMPKDVLENFEKDRNNLSEVINVMTEIIKLYNNKPLPVSVLPLLYNVPTLLTNISNHLKNIKSSQDWENWTKSYPDEIKYINNLPKLMLCKNQEHIDTKLQAKCTTFNCGIKTDHRNSIGDIIEDLNGVLFRMINIENYFKAVQLQNFMLYNFEDYKIDGSNIARTSTNHSWTPCTSYLKYGILSDNHQDLVYKNAIKGIPGCSYILNTGLNKSKLVGFPKDFHLYLIFKMVVTQERTLIE